MKSHADDLERGWRLVESRGTPAETIVTADPIPSTGSEGLMVGIDAHDARHLLIPITADAEVQVSTGTAVTLTKRSLLLDEQERTYADLACVRPDLFDEFAVLSADVVAELEKDASAPADSAARVLADWRELLRALGAPRLDRGGLIGLYAELTALETILALDPRRGVECWTGPSRGRYDFQRGDKVVEVKASTARRGRPIVVHGIDQLEAPPNADLYLLWIRLEVGIARGESLRSIVERLLDRVQNSADLEQKLLNMGYAFETPEVYERPLFTELERGLYRVDEGFPRLTRAHLISGDLPRGITAVTYEIDLSGDDPKPVSEEDRQRVLLTLAGLA